MNQCSKIVKEIGLDGCRQPVKVVALLQFLCEKGLKDLNSLVASVCHNMRVEIKKAQLRALKSSPQGIPNSFPSSVS